MAMAPFDPYITNAPGNFATPHVGSARDGGREEFQMAMAPFDPYITNAAGDIGIHVGRTRNDGDGDNDDFLRDYDPSIFSSSFDNPTTAQTNVGQGPLNEDNSIRVDEPEPDLTQWFANVNWEQVDFNELLSAVNKAEANNSRARSAKLSAKQGGPPPTQHRKGKPRRDKPRGGRHASGRSCSEEQSMTRSMTLFFRETLFVNKGKVTTHFDPNGISPYEMAVRLYPLALQKRGHSDTVCFLAIRLPTKLNTCDRDFRITRRLPSLLLRQRRYLICQAVIKSSHDDTSKDQRTSAVMDFRETEILVISSTMLLYYW